MGAVKKVLCERELEALPSSYVGIELCETVHLHVPGFRWELTLQQFLEFAEIIRVAVKHWKNLNGGFIIQIFL